MAGAENRLRSYKNKGLDAEEGRRRREEEGVQLRKSRRDEQISKRRNLETFARDPSDDAVNSLISEDTSIQFLAGAVHSGDPTMELAATRVVRKRLAATVDPPIRDVLESGILPKMVEFLGNRFSSDLQFEAAWVLTNVASGTSLDTKAVIDAGAVPALIELLRSSTQKVIDQAVWALGNIAGDNAEFRDFVLSHRVLEPLLSLLMNQSLGDVVRRNGAWALSNLCRGKKSSLTSEQIMACLAVVYQLLYSDDPHIVVDSCWAAAFLSDGPNHKIQLVINSGIVKRLVELLMHPDKLIVSPSLRAIGNILTGDDPQTQVVINCSVLPALQHLLSSPVPNLKKEACWALSNISAGNKVQIQAIVDSNIFPELLTIMENAEYKTRKEATWAVLNAMSSGTQQQIKYLISIGCIPHICSMLTVDDPRILLVTLEGLEIILKTGHSAVPGQHDNPYGLAIEEAGGLDKIEYLQNHDSDAIYQAAHRIIDRYFSSAQDVSPHSTMEPRPSQDGRSFVFSSGLPPPGNLQL